MKGIVICGVEAWRLNESDKKTIAVEMYALIISAMKTDWARYKIVLLDISRE